MLEYVVVDGWCWTIDTWRPCEHCSATDLPCIELDAVRVRVWVCFACLRAAATAADTYLQQREG